MSRGTFEPSFYLSLTEFLLHAKQQIASLAREFGLTSMQALTLLSLSGESRTMTGLGHLLDCDASNITGIIDGLEEKGLVKREPSVNDRRIKLIRLQPEGKRIKDLLAAVLDTNSTTMFEGLTASETKQFAQLVEKMATAQALKVS